MKADDKWPEFMRGDTEPTLATPKMQGQRFDPNGAYIRRWLPELSELPNRVIHCPWQASPKELGAAGVVLGETYPLPIVDHREARTRALTALADSGDRAHE